MGSDGSVSFDELPPWKRVVCRAIHQKPEPLTLPIRNFLYSSHDAIEAAIEDQGFGEAIEDCARMIVESLLAGGQILIAGNGGSAAQAQHFAAELVGRFVCDRRPLPAIALGTDPATLTAIANDYGWEHAIERQLLALARPNSVFIAISTSGQSANILRAADTAFEEKISVIAMTGKPGLPLVGRSHRAIVAPSSVTPLVQQLHLVAAHLICLLVEQFVIATPGLAAGFASK
jgi:D-sedoheptulose 7-phosphate isomerase